MNLIWTALAKGHRFSALQYSRKTSPSEYVESREFVRIIDTIIPYGDNLLRSFHIEEYTKVILMSVLRERALQFDPLNTYEKSILQFPDPGVSNTDAPMDIKHEVDRNAFRDLGNGILETMCTVIPGPKLFTTEFGTQNFTMTNGLSSRIEVYPGFNLRLSGTLPGATFSFGVTYIATPRVVYTRIINLPDDNIQWVDGELRDIWNTDVDWVNRIAALALNAAEGSIR